MSKEQHPSFLKQYFHVDLSKPYYDNLIIQQAIVFLILIVLHNLFQASYQAHLTIKYITIVILIIEGINLVYKTVVYVIDAITRKMRKDIHDRSLCMIFSLAVVSACIYASYLLPIYMHEYHITELNRLYHAQQYTEKEQYLIYDQVRLETREFFHKYQNTSLYDITEDELIDELKRSPNLQKIQSPREMIRSIKRTYQHFVPSSQYMIGHIESDDRNR